MKIVNRLQRKLWWPIVFGASLITLIQPAMAEERYPGETSRTMERGGPITKVPTYGQRKSKEPEGNVQENPSNTVNGVSKGTGSVAGGLERGPENTGPVAGGLERGSERSGDMEGGDPGDTGAVPSAPTFQQADKNGDHYVSRDELRDYPVLLKRFDEVDAGKDGKLEEHEYGNLVMEKSREKGR